MRKFRQKYFVRVPFFDCLYHPLRCPKLGQGFRRSDGQAKHIEDGVEEEVGGEGEETRRGGESDQYVLSIFLLSVHTAWSDPGRGKCRFSVHSGLLCRIGVRRGIAISSMR